MAVIDQRHCLAVAQALHEQGQQNPDLLAPPCSTTSASPSPPFTSGSGWHTCSCSAWHRRGWDGWAPAGPAASATGYTSSPTRRALGGDLAAQAGLPATVVALVRGEGDPQQQEALRQMDDLH